MAQLRGAGIPAAMRANAAVVDHVILAQTPMEQQVPIHSSDFPRAHMLIKVQAGSMLVSVRADHAMLSFTNEEWIEVIAKTHFGNGVPSSDWIISDPNTRSIQCMFQRYDGRTMLIIITVIITLVLPGSAYPGSTGRYTLSTSSSPASCAHHPTRQDPCE